MVLERTGRIKEDDRVGNFVTDACATVAVAAVRLLTMATIHKCEW